MKNKINLFFFFLFTVLALTLTAIVANAQDSTIVNPTPFSGTIVKYFMAAYAIFEAIVLFLPSTKNVSLIGNILKWLSGGGNRAK